MNYLVDTLAIDHRVNVSNSIHSLTDSVVGYIFSRKPDFCAVVYDEPDKTGHQHGWESTEYYDRLKELDGCIQKLVQAIEDAGMLSESAIIITSDHGGVDYNHGGISLVELETSLVFYGAGIKKGEIMQSTMKYDIASTIAYMFGVEQPAIWVGKPILSVFN